MEILWPLILFFILVAVRTRGLRKFNHQCKYSSVKFKATENDKLMAGFCHSALWSEFRNFVQKL